MQNKYSVLILQNVERFLDNLLPLENAKILSALKVIEMGDFTSVHIKSLKGEIKELIIKRYRIRFFIDKNIVYCIAAFVKKSAKTPKREMENAERIYKKIIIPK